jgi:glycerophosphoryl diester phosphodiesterase
MSLKVRAQPATTIFLIGALTVVLAGLVLTVAPSHGGQVVVIAHRGEHRGHPENTLPALEAAIRLGADYVEVDVRTTADGALVLSHDADVSRCTDGQGEVARMTLAEIRALDAGIKTGPQFSGTRIPSFGEALDSARGRVGLYVDVKRAGARALLRQIDERGMARQVLVYSRIGKEIQELNPTITIVPAPVSVEIARKVVALLHPRAFAFSARDFTPEVIAVAKEANAKIYVDLMGRTDDPAGWRAAVDAGADGIQTDRPGELVRFLRAAGRRD